MPGIALIGVGGAGCEAAARVREKYPSELAYLMVDTDEQSLRRFDGCTAVDLGRDVQPRPFCTLTPEWVAAAVRHDMPLLVNLLADARHVIVVAGLGGVTGSEAAPAVMRLVQDIGAVAYGVFSLPFRFEGPLCHERAVKALDEVRRNLLIHLHYPADREIEGRAGDTTLKQCYALLNHRLVYGATLWTYLLRTILCPHATDNS